MHMKKYTITIDDGGGGETNFQKKKKTISPNNHIAPIIRQKRQLHERSISNLSNDPAQHFQSLREDLVVRDCSRVEGVVLGCHAAAVVARFEKFRGVGAVPRFFVRGLFLFGG